MPTPTLRRLRRVLSVGFLATAFAAAAATYAVHLDASGRVPGGLLGDLIGGLEVLFVTAIIPLTLAALYCGARLLSLALAATNDATMPSARARR